MTTTEILNAYKAREIDLETALDKLADIGACPGLINDDNGHWAVSFVGLQNVPIGTEPIDIQSTFFVEAEYWKNTPREALIYALEQ